MSEQPQKAILESLFGSKARVAVLRLFMLDPTRAYYQRQLEGATGLAIRAVQRELDRLTAAGLLYRRVDGNRAYYQVDVHFSLFEDLRGLVLKTCSPVDRLRGSLAMDVSVRLGFLHEPTGKVLIVTQGAKRPAASLAAPFEMETMTSDEFVRALVEARAKIDPYLTEGHDLLGRRDDIIWRRIEMAGYDVERARGVA